MSSAFCLLCKATSFMYQTTGVFPMSSATCGQVKSVMMIHYKGDERVVYEACRSLVDSMPTEDKVKPPPSPPSASVAYVGIKVRSDIGGKASNAKSNALLLVEKETLIPQNWVPFFDVAPLVHVLMLAFRSTALQCSYPEQPIVSFAP